MACCNNECLENINAACIDYTGEDFTCLSNTNKDLESVLQNIDAIICSTSFNGEDTELTIDAKCLSGECTTTIPFSVDWVSTVSNDTLVVNAPTVPSTAVVHIVLYSGVTSIVTLSQLGVGTTIPVSWNNNNGLTGTIQIITDANTSPYTGTFYVPQNASTSTIGGVLNCSTASVLTLTIKTLFEMTINKICDLQNQINVLNG